MGLLIKPPLAIARLRLHASMMSICLFVCLSVTFRDSTLNTANLCPAISVVGLFYLFTVMFTFVVDIESYGVDFTRRFRFCMCA